MDQELCPLARSRRAINDGNEIIDSSDSAAYAWSMASLTIRKLDDSVKAKLRVRAAENGRSMEEEARAILETAVAPGTRSKSGNFYESIRRRLAEAGIEEPSCRLLPASRRTSQST